MEDWIKANEPILYGVWFIVLGILVLLYMKYRNRKEGPDPYFSPMSQSVRFGLYLMGILGILGGIFILVREL